MRGRKKKKKELSWMETNPAYALKAYHRAGFLGVFKKYIGLCVGSSLNLQKFL